MNKLLNPKIIYPAISLIFFLVLGVVFFYIIRFFLDEVKGAFEIDQAKVDAELKSANIEMYKEMAPKVGVDVNKL